MGQHGTWRTETEDWETERVRMGESIRSLKREKGMPET